MDRGSKPINSKDFLYFQKEKNTAFPLARSVSIHLKSVSVWDFYLYFSQVKNLKNVHEPELKKMQLALITFVIWLTIFIHKRPP